MADTKLKTRISDTVQILQALAKLPVNAGLLQMVAVPKLLYLCDCALFSLKDLRGQLRTKTVEVVFGSVRHTRSAALVLTMFCKGHLTDCPLQAVPYRANLNIKKFLSKDAALITCCLY